MSAWTSDEAQVLSVLLELLRIDSPSGAEGECADFVTRMLERSGWDVSSDGTGPQTGNVIARLHGRAEPLLFTSHLDVVVPCEGVRPHVEDGWVMSGGDTTLGADAKASVAALLVFASTATSVPESDRPALEFLFTWGEEEGLMGAKALDARSLMSKRAFVLDALVPVGTIIHRAPTHRRFTATVGGPGGHAAVDAGSASAIVAAAKAIADLPWGQLDEETTANVGTMRGGTARNAIASEVIVDGEVRGLTPHRVAERASAVRRAFESAASPGLEVEVEIHPLYEGYSIPINDRVVTLAADAFRALGGSPSITHTLGGSDANVLNAAGITSCVLGIGAVHCHSLREKLAVVELLRLREWVTAIVALAARLPSPVGGAIR